MITAEHFKNINEAYEIIEDTDELLVAKLVVDRPNPLPFLLYPGMTVLYDKRFTRMLIYKHFGDVRLTFDGFIHDEESFNHVMKSM